MNQQVSWNQKVGGWFSNPWKALSTPNASIRSASARRQAELLAGLSLLLVVVSIVGIIVTFSTATEFTLSLILEIPLALVVMLVYGLSRTSHYRLATWILVVGLAATGFTDAISSTTPIETILIYLAIAYLITVGMFSIVEIGIFTLLGVIASITLPFIFASFSWAIAGIIVGQVVIFGVLSMAVIASVRAAEQDRVNEVLRTSEQLQQLSTSLEQRVSERTRDIALAADFGRRIAAVHDLNILLPQAVELIQERYNLYYVQIYLLDTTGKTLIMRSGSGRVGEEMLRRDHRLPLDLTSLNGTAALERRAVVVEDAARSLLFRPHPLLPDTRSELAIPLIFGERVLGVLDLQSSKPGGLTSDDLPAFEIVASQFAIALLNAELFDQVQRSLVEVETRSRQIAGEGWNDYMNGIDAKERIAFAYEHGTTQLLSAPLPVDQDPNRLSAPIAVSGEPIGELQFDGIGAWTADDQALVSVVSAQLAQQLENLRLLSQADRYRDQMEDALRRLTREEWQEFLDEAENKKLSFEYDGEAVKEASVVHDEQATSIKRDIKVRDEIIGQFGLNASDQLSPDDQEVVDAISGQLGEHLENLRLYTSAQRELIERARLEKVILADRSQLSDAMDVAHMVNWEYDVESGSFVFNDRFYEFLGTSIEEEGSYVMPAQEYAERFVYPDDAWVVAAKVQEALDTDDPNYTYAESSRMFLTDGRVVEVMVRSRIEKDANGRTVRLYGANQDITAQRQAERTIAKRAAELATVSQVATTVAIISSPDEMLQTVVDLTKTSFNLYHAHIYLVDEASDMLVLTKGAGEVGRQMVAEGRQISRNAEKSLVARAARTRQGVIVNDVHQDPEFLPHPLLPETRSEMAVPLLSGDTVIGVLDVQAETIDRFTEEDVLIESTLAAQVAVALQNARQYEQTQTSERLVRSVIDGTSDWIYIKDQQHRYRLVNQGYANSLHIPVEDFIGKDDLEMGYPEELVKGNPQKGIAGFWADDNEVMNSGESKIIPRNIVVVDGEQRTLNTLKIPIRDASGQVNGVLAFSRDMTEQIQAQQTIAKRAAELATVSQVATTVAVISSPDEMLQTVVDLTKTSFNLYHAHIYLVDEASDMLVLTKGAGEVGRQMVAEGRQISRNAEKSLVARAARTRQGVIVNDVHQDPEFLPHPLLPETRSEMAVPLLSGDTVIGVLDVQAETIDRFTEEDVLIKTTLAAQVAVALQNARQYEQTQASERLIRDVIDSTPDWIFIKDQQHRYRLVNQGYASSLHIPVEDFIGKDDIDLGFPEELVKGNPEKGIAGFWADDNEVINSGESKIIPKDIVVIDGEQRTLNTLKTPLRDPNGQVLGVLAFSRDVTERETLLADAEVMYAVTSQLAQARSHKDVLDAVVGGTILRSFDWASMYYFEHPWRDGDIPQIVTTEAVWENVTGTFPAQLGQPSSAQALSGIENLKNAPYIFIHDVREAAGVDEMMREMMIQTNMISSLNLRLMVGGEWVGYISAVAATPRELEDQEMRRLMTLIDQATTVLYSLFQYQATQERARREQVLREITARVRGSMDPEVILRTAVRELGTALGRQTFIRLGSSEQLLEKTGNGNGQPKNDNDSAVMNGEGGK